ncbi:MAG: Oxidoreductase [Pycnora praestabilis]|nr:MAG: Oxidoreductase [Pycnora praestabilis]
MMIRPASRSVLRTSLRSQFPKSQGTRRFLSTAPPSQKSRNWKSSALRWSLAIGGVYYYNTSNVFAEEPAYSFSTAPDPQDDSSSLPTLEALSEQRRRRAALASKADDEQPPLAANESSLVKEVEEGSSPGAPQTAQEYEEEADQQGAFNPETGEINWDCPCLGGMAHGPCGEQFRAAFSCFVYSKEEPKGVDCIDRFKGMQDCFREHPDVYGAELDEEEEEQVEEQGALATSRNAASPSTETSTSPEPTSLSTRGGSGGEKVAHVNSDKSDPEADAKTKRAAAATKQVHEEHAPHDESDALVPKAWHDTIVDNEGK